ncbi:DUF1499 domain-containing protein [Halodesulfovibrio marinisediminis]|nr:DUF1499 domain-containing protein [Halodesulfovibrio marinisediminis]
MKKTKPNAAGIIKWLFIILCTLMLAGFLFFKHLGTWSADISPKLGVTNGQFAAMPETPNAVSSQTGIESKHVEPLPMTGSVKQTKNKILQCLQELGSNKIVTQNEDYIHAVFVSPIMKYHDDVEFFIDTTTQKVQFRSTSRVGKYDLGANRARYDAFKKLYLR